MYPNYNNDRSMLKKINEGERIETSFKLIREKFNSSKTALSNISSHKKIFQKQFSL